ncbi:MAG: glyoxylate/hydroxypyruvate reductase A [Beijerinckiaceae bacterium]|nr:glyoxylate/hydroxypyruvate reductase A [Beijerinckiaceae bacterium]
MMQPIPFLSQSDEAEQAAWVEALSLAMPDERIVPFAALGRDDGQAARVAIVANPDPAEVAQLPGLVWIQSLWAGVERIVHDLQGFDGTIVRLVDPELARTMAEAVLAWTLYLHRDMPAYAAAQREARWRPLDYVRPQERSIGLLGLGELGRAAAGVLLQAGFPVRGWSRTAKTVPGVETLHGEDGLADMLSKTDILVCLLPLTPQTRRLLGRRTLSHLPRGASLINFGRGPVVVVDDLIALLDDAHIAHAVLDVFEREPLPQESRLWSHPAVTVLPHISAETNRTTAAAIAAANIRAFRQSGAVPKGIDRTLGY